MKLKNQILAVVLSILMLFQTGILVSAQEVSKKETTEKKEQYEKKESVYAKLAADGTAKDGYVVNHFSVNQPGKITDYGNYTAVKNLTNLDTIETEGDKSDFTAEEGEFYYQGTIDNIELPWIFTMEYQLNGEKVLPEDLGGKSGALKINISIKKNPTGQKTFFKNYVTQISGTFDNEKTKNIKAKGATIADAGSDTQVSFTLLPGKEAKYSIEAEITDFSMSGFSIAAVPYSMEIDMEDYGVDNLTGQFDELIDATDELSSGMKKLSEGMDELDGNSATLLNGFKELKNGIGTLDNNSATLLSGSAQIKKALSKIATSLSKADFSEMSKLKELPKSIDKLSAGLKKLKSGLGQLKQGFDQSYIALDQAMQEAKEVTLSQEELAAAASDASTKAQEKEKLTQAYKKLDAAVSSAMGALPDNKDIQKILDSIKGSDASLYAKLANLYVQAKALKETYAETSPQIEAVADDLSKESSSTEKLLKSYKSLQKILGTWDAAKPAFAAVSEALDEKNENSVISGLDSVTNGLDQMSKSLSQSLNGVDIEKQMKGLSSGLSQLNSSYASFHKGLTSYMKGVSSLFDGAVKYQSGLSQYLGGVGETAEGSEKLKDGMKEYSDGVAGIPDTMQKKVDEMMKEYSSSDYKPVSFTDKRNKNVESVQFVIATQEIKKTETKKVKETKQKEGFIDRLKSLFK